MDKEPILVKFGKKVQELRIEQNLSQEQLAELAGVHRTYIGMVERAEKNITLRNIAFFCDDVKDRQNTNGVSINLCINSFRKRARDVFIESAAGNM